MACRNHNGTTDDLPIQTAALHASCLVDYLARATDERGCKLRHEYILSNTLALVGAGFVTSSSFLAWLIYSLVTYPGQQDRLLQELVNHGATLDKNWSYDEIQAMPFLDAFVKETQRMHSPSFQPARNVKRDVVLPADGRFRKAPSSSRASRTSTGTRHTGRTRIVSTQTDGRLRESAIGTGACMCLLRRERVVALGSTWLCRK